MDKILIGLLVFLLLIGVTCGVFAILNKNNSQEMMEYIDTFAVEDKNSSKLVPQKDEQGNWYFVTDEDFKILHLTDIHLEHLFLRSNIRIPQLNHPPEYIHFHQRIQSFHYFLNHNKFQYYER